MVLVGIPSGITTGSDGELTPPQAVKVAAKNAGTSAVFVMLLNNNLMLMPTLACVCTRLIKALFIMHTRVSLYPDVGNAVSMNNG